MTKLALAQLPARARRRVLIRTDSGGGTHEFLAWLASPAARLQYSIGMTITDDMRQAILQLPDRIWEADLEAADRSGPAPGWPSSPAWPT